MTFAERLNYILDKQGVPPKNKGRIQILSKMVGLTHRGASKWLNGETKPPQNKYSALAKKLNVTEDWLKTGVGKMLNTEEVQYTTSQLTVPVYNDFDLPYPRTTAIKNVHCELPLEGNYIGFKLTSEAMSPRFPKNTIIVIDLNKTYKDGDFALVKTSSFNNPIFRQIICSENKFYLTSHNPRFDNMYLDSNDSIIGVMVIAIISFP
jgi:phage repressor protein C with HTH and peptisase S24 domain